MSGSWGPGEGEEEGDRRNKEEGVIGGRQETAEEDKEQLEDWVQGRVEAIKRNRVGVGVGESGGSKGAEVEVSQESKKVRRKGPTRE